MLRQLRRSVSARSRPEAKSHYVHRPLRSTSTYISTLLYSTVAAPMALRRLSAGLFASGISESSMDDAARRRGEAFLESERPSSSRRVVRQAAFAQLPGPYEAWCEQCMRVVLLLLL